MKREKKRKIFSKSNFIRSTKGVISIFLAILMVPFTTLAGALISAARVNSASAIFDEAMSNASESTLATWDSFLKDRFGLLATKQLNSVDDTNKQLNETFSKYLDENLLSLSNTFFDVESNCKGMYSLADTNVLLYQILEYSKYNIPTTLVIDGLDIDNLIKSLEQLIPGYNWLSMISSGANLGSTVIDLGNASNSYADAAEETNNAKNYYDSSYSALETTLSSIASTISERNRVLSQYESKISSKNSEVSSKEASASNARDKADSITVNLNKLISLRDALLELSDINSDVLNKELQETVSECIEAGLLNSSVDVTKIKVSELLDIVEEKIEATEEEKESADSDSTKESKELDKAKSDLASLESQKSQAASTFTNRLNTLYSEAKTNKTNYSNDIQDFITKLEYEKTQKNKYDSAKNNVVSSVVSVADSAMDTLSKEDIEKINSQKEMAESTLEEIENSYKKGDITKEQYESAKNQWNGTVESCTEQIKGVSNTKTVFSDVANGVKTMISESTDNLEEFTEAKYDATINRLKDLKGNVDSFDTDSVDSDFSASNFKSNYYVSGISLVTKQMVLDAEQKLIAELTSDSIWSMIKSLIDILKSLFKILLPFDPNLNTNRDKEYYKNFDWDNLENGNADDKQYSDYYKRLFGSFSATDMNSDDDFSFVDAIIAIFEDVEYISNNIIKDAVASLIDFGESWKNIENHLEDAKTQFSNLIDWATNILQTVYEKVLLAGYLSYNTSCRTTYSNGTALTGVPFNLRGQTSNLEKSVDNINGIGDFLALIKSSVVGETAKCFVGAETEYLINGKDSEIENQLWTLLEVYVIRFICNIYIVVTSPEVAEIAAATTIGAPIVYILFALLEPLVDCAIITNGGTVPVVKNQPYLVPTGLSSMFTKLSGLAATSSQISKKKQSFEDAVNKYAKDNDDNKTYKVSSDNNKVGSAINISAQSENTKFNYKRSFELDYKTYLFIYLMFCSSENLIKRFRDIVEMESVQNLYVKNGEKSWEGINFDIARSYTYLRAEAKFSTNEFIRISGSNINMNKRLLYRGY